MYHASCNVSAPDQNFAADCDVFAQKWEFRNRNELLTSFLEIIAYERTKA